MTDNPGEASILDIFMILLRRWYILVGAPVLVGLLGAVYYAQAKDLIQSEILLYDTNYPIRYATHTRALAPHWHHMELAQSPIFLTKVAIKLQAEGVFDEVLSPEALRQMFNVEDNRGRSGPILVTVSENSIERARRALNVWEGVYALEAPRYRARHLLHEMRAESLARLDRQREMEAVLSGVEGLIQQASSSSNPDTNYLAALHDRRVSLQIEQLAAEFRDQFHQELTEFLQSQMEGTEYTASPKVLETANGLLLEGLEGLFSEQKILYHPAQNMAKVLSLAVTALLFTATCIVITECFLQRVKKK